jgi:hypothetical protein
MSFGSKLKSLKLGAPSFFEEAKSSKLWEFKLWAKAEGC